VQNHGNYNYKIGEMPAELMFRCMPQSFCITMEGGDELTIQGLEGASSISFVDVNGKVVKEQRVNETGSIKRSLDLASGIYFVKISTAGKIATIKIIIK
jgi:hypothetical protein